MDSITAAVEGMEDLLAEEQAPPWPVVFGSAGLSVGAFATQELRARTEPHEPPPARMFYDARRDLLGLRH